MSDTPKADESIKPKPVAITIADEADRFPQAEMRRLERAGKSDPLAGHEWRKVTGKLVSLLITEHPQYRCERNKRKRTRWKKRLKRMGITEYHAPQIWWETTGEQ